jgi:serine-type D-Ala-D-Ala carboxypeptidase (penicillin-binding protein 5/6)
MKKLQQLMIAFITSTIFFSVAFANPPSNVLNSQAQVLLGQQTKTKSTPPALIPPPPNLDVKGYVLMDAKTGKVIAKKNMNKQLQPASLTKLMTLYITFKALANGQINLNDKVRISKEAWQQGGSRMFLKLGSHVAVKDLIDGVIVASGNDASVALAQYIAGTQASFAKLMNITAKSLGMKNTHYVDPTGLPRPGHVSTPYDLALLTQAIIRDYPQYYHFFKQKWITWNKIRQPNRNRLLWRDQYVDGLKTGHTKEAGYCLISSAKKMTPA